MASGGIRPRRRLWLGLGILAFAVAFAETMAIVEAEQAPAARGRAQGPAAGRGQGPGRGGRGNPNEGADFLKRPPVVRLDPAVQQQLFLLPEGYSIEPVLTDPLITDPVGISFDGNGRMYVLEMRSYMRDAEGTGSREPISRISRHEDTDGDGTYDRHTVFADGLVMPRVAFPLQDGVVLVLETDNRDLYKYTDTNGDGVSDTKEIFYRDFGRVTNMEWQPGGLTWALDNWLYSTYNPYRLRIAPDGSLLREETEPNGGQWWSAQDNYGKMWWVDGGGEIGPVNFQTPIIYGAFNVEDNFEPDFQVPNSAPGGIADMQGGMRRVKLPEGTLNHFTAAAGPEIYRGHRLPEELQGDLLFNEPVGRIVRDANVVVREGLTQLQNAYPGSEFVRSTDPLFRPVSIHNAPDGTLYLVDMYTGIIQDAQFVGPQSYLRQKIEQYALDQQHNNGRIWRIRYTGMEPDRTQPRMFSAPASQLVSSLEHPSGWWRDAAQKELVLRQDTSVVAALQTMARSSNNQLGRIHALWTLEGLGALDAGLVRELAASPDPKIRIQAIRASETLYKAGDRSFAQLYKDMIRDADPEVVIQAMLTLNLHDIDGADALIQSTASAASARGVREIGRQIFDKSAPQGQMPSLADAGVATVNLSVEDRRMLQRGASTYRELCTTCHGPDGKGAPMEGTAGATLAPALAGSNLVNGHRQYVIRILLHGLTGPLNGETYGAGVMVPMGTNTDQWIADVANFVRTSFGNSAPMISPEDVARVRASSSRTEPYTLAELEAAVPRLLSVADGLRATASHNAGAAANALTDAEARWDSGEPMRPGMWFQVELPQPTRVEEVQFDSAPAGPSFGRGRGQIPAGPPAGYSIQVSPDGTTWSQPVARGAGTRGVIAAFDPVTAKFVRITATEAPAPARGGSPGSPNLAWAIHNVRVYAAGQ